MSKKLLIIYTGGTIGMQNQDDGSGYTPIAGLLPDLMAKMPSLQHPDMPAYDFFEFPTLIDSAEMTPAHWQAMGQVIADNYTQYDGFIILHGTDTMAYSASALSFMLENLGKPVILTGSQVPLIEAHTDARENLIGAMLIAANYLIPEVMIFFDNILLRGNRSQKVNANSFHAFASPNFPSLGRMALNIELRKDLILAAPTRPFQLQKIKDIKLGHIRLFPGVTVEILHNMLAQPIQALVMESYGVGNAPIVNEKLMAVLHDAITRNVVIINCSQCHHSSVDMSGYATGIQLQKMGVLSAYDMTSEAILTKLYYLLSKYPQQNIHEMWQQNLRGELEHRT